MATKLDVVAENPVKKGAGKAVKKPGQKAGAAAAAAGKGARRKERMARIEQANKITVTLQTDVRRALAAQARAAGMDMGHFMQKLAESHIIDSAPEGDPLAARLKARRSVVDHVVKLAQEMQAEGGFDADFILKVLKRAHADAGFAGMYAAAVADTADKPKQAARADVALNQQLGRLIKRAVGAKSKRDAAGKIMRAQVKGEVISSYTLLEMPAA
ncbi:hypothetical protein [Aquicoccus sp. SU-CL01552]|uniref:hypothetical protein n=1 Tax=Aquicoccus sp. SU-CL01552 TaxID=3127656 RepID=UPI003103504B